MLWLHCHEKFSSYENFKRHISSFHGVTLTNNFKNTKEVPYLTKEKLAVVYNERNSWTYECFICHENFTSYANFKKHTSSLHGVTLTNNFKNAKEVPQTWAI